jgi:uncharacterized membrane-anchored protein
MKTVVSGRLALVLLSVSLCLTAAAADTPGGPLGKLKWVKGPGSTELGKWAGIEVPAGYLFLGGEDTRMLMSAMGNFCNGNEVGFLTTASYFDTNDTTSAKWFVVFEFDECGYVKDDEKKDLQADSILQSFKDGTERSNVERRKRGDPGLTIIGWDVPPRYNESTHNLEWCIRAKDDNGNLVINHNTRVLGRHGVMKAILVADPGQLPAIMPEYDKRIAGFQFKSGEKYSEYRQGDKIAKYGLAALIAGGAAAAAVKTGLLQKIIKPLIIGLIAVGAFFKKIFGRFFGKKDQGASGEPPQA